MHNTASPQVGGSRTPEQLEAHRLEQRAYRARIKAEGGERYARMLERSRERRAASYARKLARQAEADGVEIVPRAPIAADEFVANTPE